MAKMQFRDPSQPSLKSAIRAEKKRKLNLAMVLYFSLLLNAGLIYLLWRLHV